MNTLYIVLQKLLEGGGGGGGAQHRLDLLFCKSGHIVLLGFRSTFLSVMQIIFLRNQFEILINDTVYDTNRT